MPHDDFDARAATWDDPAKVARAQQIADAMVKTVSLEGVQEALEYGCGTGLVTWALAPHLDAHAHVTLADSSTGMLAVVRERIEGRASDSRRYTAQTLDLTSEAFPAHSLDLIYTSLALHHVSDVDLVLQRFAEALRPGGHLAIADLDHDPLGHFHGTDFHGHHGFKREALASRIIAAGFNTPQIETVTTLTKPVDGVPTEFGMFLAVASVA